MAEAQLTRFAAILKDCLVRVLFLASYFPRPTDPVMGTWALSQAQAFARRGLAVTVRSYTPWIPPLLAMTSGARKFANCPATAAWGNVTAEYPRWLYYPVGKPKRWAHRSPQRQMALAWQSVRKNLIECIRRESVDVIYAHHVLPNGYIAARIRDELGIPFVVTEHAFEAIEDCERYPNRLAMMKYVTDRAYRTIAVSSRMGQAMQRLLPGARSVTLHNGADPLPAEVFQTPRPPELNGTRVVFTAGHFYPRKAFPLLVKAFARAAKNVPDAVLRIAGDGAERPAVEAAIAETGIAGRVSLLGFQPRARVLQEMAWSDVFALVGWDEPFATVFLEAMSAGKPLIWATDGGITDVVADEVHGLAVAPHDLESATTALSRLLGDDSLRVHCGRAGRELIESRLNWDANAATMEGYFSEALREQA